MSESKVAGHYTRGKLEETILQALTRAGINLDQLTARDLTSVDEFHIGGLEATQELAVQMEVAAGTAYS